MTVTDNLRMGAYLRKDKAEVRRDLDDIYDHFPVLKERGKQLAESLSGGEQQMLAVARALMGKPKLLLMDEPSMGLSPIMVEMVAQIIVDDPQARTERAPRGAERDHGPCPERQGVRVGGGVHRSGGPGRETWPATTSSRRRTSGSRSLLKRGGTGMKIGRFVVDGHIHCGKKDHKAPQAGSEDTPAAKAKLPTFAGGEVIGVDSSDWAVFDMDAYGIDMGILLPSFTGTTKELYGDMVKKRPDRFRTCIMDTTQRIKAARGETEWTIEAAIKEIDEAVTAEPDVFVGIGEFAPGCMGTVRRPPSYEQRVWTNGRRSPSWRSSTTCACTSTSTEGTGPCAWAFAPAKRSTCSA